MIGIFKVVGLLQSIPSFNPLHDGALSASQEDLELGHTYIREDLFNNRSAPKDQPKKEGSDSNSTTSRRGRNSRDNKRDDNDDNNNNGGGGLLEPLIEDLQGFIKGRRTPVLNL